MQLAVFDVKLTVFCFQCCLFETDIIRKPLENLQEVLERFQRVFKGYSGHFSYISDLGFLCFVFCVHYLCILRFHQHSSCVLLWSIS